MSVWWLLIGTIAVLICYTALPELIFHILHLTVTYKQKKVSRKIIALTFDDGPDPHYTPQVLQILDQYHAKATFFLVGSRAAKHPGLVEAILRAGHDIANHSWFHVNAWFQLPLQTIREISATRNELQRLSGRAIRYYRPPWGMFNAVTRFACATLGLHPVLWSVSSYDWRTGDTTRDIVRRVCQSQAGDIVLMHDNGGAPGAPLNTIRALPIILEHLSEDGFAFVTVSELEAQKATAAE